jgi:SanA protein
MRLPSRKTTLIAVVGTIASGVLLVAVTNAIVLLGGGGSVDRPADAPHAQVALVLGAEVRPDGTMSAMLADRVATAAELYKAGKVDRVLVSGDHGRLTYDEPNTMKRALVKAVGSVATGASPRFLGPPVPITGDAQASDG